MAVSTPATAANITQLFTQLPRAEFIQRNLGPGSLLRGPLFPAAALNMRICMRPVV